MKKLKCILTMTLFCVMSSLMAKIQIKCPRDLDLGCIRSKSEIPKPDPKQVTTDSECRGITVLHVNDQIFEEGCTTKIVRYYQATNDCKEEISCRQIILYVFDNVAPVFQNCDVVIDLGCNPDLKRLLPDAETDNIKATDNCGIEKIVLISEQITENGCQFYSTRKYRAYDHCGNSSECKKVFHWTVDKKKPIVLSGPKDLDFGCNPFSIYFPEYDENQFKIEDACSKVSVLIKEVTWDTSGCDKSRCTLYNIVDQCGNETVYKHCLKWCIDEEAPQVSCPKPLLLGCNPENIPEADISKIIAWDNCDKPLHVYVAASSISVNDCLYKLYRTYTVEDQAGNKSSCDEIFMWYESEGIQFAECPVDFDMGVLHEAPAYFPNFTISLQAEGCGIDSSWYVDSEVMSQACSSYVVRTWYIQDICGFKDSCQQTFWWVLDTAALSCPADQHFPCTAKWDDMVPQFEVGEIIDHNECTGSKLIFAYYALDAVIDIVNCKGRFGIYYYLIEDGDTTLCQQAITWDLALGDCPCIDDITTLPPDDICPEDLYISCSDSHQASPVYRSYSPGQLVRANTRGERLYLVDRGSEITNCLEIIYVHYQIHDAAGHVTDCIQKITLEIESDRCPCIDDLTANPGDGICPKNQHHPCNTPFAQMFPYVEGQWLDSTSAGTQLIFDQYGFDILFFGCTATRSAHYLIIQPDGDTVRCYSIITWDHAGGDCGCIDDFTLDPGSDKLCPEDIHFPCGTDVYELFPYSPGDVVASDGAATLYFDYYGFDITVYDCKGHRTAYYYIVHPNGLRSECEQEITWEITGAGCSCIDDFTLDPGSDKLCPEDIHFPCGTDADELFPYSPGDLVASDGSATLYFDHYDFDILVVGCQGSRTAQYYIVHANDLITPCQQKITWDLASTICPCIDDFSSGGHHSTPGNVTAYDIVPHDWSNIHDFESGPDLYQIYPNPALQDFTLEVKSDVGAVTNVRVSDVRGRVWYESPGDGLKDTTLKINSEAWPAGIYLVTLVTDSDIQTKRLIKQ